MRSENVRYKDIPQSPDARNVSWLLDDAAEKLISYGSLQGIDRAAVAVNAFLFGDEGQLEQPILPLALKENIETSKSEVVFEIPLGKYTDGLQLKFTFKKYTELEPMLSAIIREGEPVQESETKDPNYEGAGKFMLIWGNGTGHTGIHTGLMRDEFREYRYCQPPYYRMTVALEHMPVEGRRNVDEKEKELVKNVAFKGGIVVASATPKTA